MILLHAAIRRLEVGVATLGAREHGIYQLPSLLLPERHLYIYTLTNLSQIGVNLTQYLSTGNSAALHLSDALHLLLHLLLLHQSVKVLLLQLILRLRGGVDGYVFKSDTLCNVLKEEMQRDLQKMRSKSDLFLYLCAKSNGLRQTSLNRCMS